MSADVKDLVKQATRAEGKARKSKTVTDFEVAAGAYHEAARATRSLGWDLERGPHREGGTSDEDKARAKELYALATDLEKSAKLMTKECHKIFAREQIAEDPEGAKRHEKELDAIIRRAKSAEHAAEKNPTVDGFLRAARLYGEANQLAWQGKLHHGRLAGDVAVEMTARSKACQGRASELLQAAHQARHESWAGRSVMVGGEPPRIMNVLDKHGGFTAVTKMRYGSENTLWRPGALLKTSTNGTLVSFNPKSFYQTNNDVTMARYKVAGYAYPVAVWFDNKTGRRIA